MVAIYRLKDPRDSETRYIGQTVKSLPTRLSGHIRDAKKGVQYHSARWIRQLLELGLEPIIELIEQTTESDERETYWISFYLSQGARLTNILKQGGARRGYTKALLSPEHRAKLSAASKGRKIPPESVERRAAAQRGVKRGPMPAEIRQKISAASKGKKPANFVMIHTPEARAKAAAAMTGKKNRSRTEEARAATSAKLSAARKGKKATRIYQPHTEETKAKLREANLGKKHGPPSEETRRKIALANTGKVMPEAHKEKLRALHLGKKHTAEHKAKYLLARQANPANAKLNPTIVREARQRYAAGDIGYTDLAREYGVSTCVIRRAIIKETWAHVV